MADDDESTIDHHCTTESKTIKVILTKLRYTHINCHFRLK